MRLLKISVISGDVLKFGADVLVLKYAQAHYGADEAAARCFANVGISLNMPKPAEFTFQKSFGSIGPNAVLFVGVKRLHQFLYSDIRNFARNALAFLARVAPDIRSLALTIHGPGYGLDEIEAFDSELAGVVDAVANEEFPRNLESISFVELNPGRVQRLTQSLSRLLPRGGIPVDGGRAAVKLDSLAQSALRTVGYASSSKSHVFVAMPFAAEMDDVFHYGIQGAVNGAGLLCERADLSSFTGDVLDWVKRRISNATLVVADLSSANPNVYLEVGYAWGCHVPTVLLARDAADLRFDVRGQRCLLYTSIKNLEELLRNELRGILNQG
jgi:hypothetical protein